MIYVNSQERRHQNRMEEKGSDGYSEKYKKGIESLLVLGNLRICGENNTLKYLGLTIPGRFKYKGEGRKEWVGFPSFKDTSVKQRIEADFNRLENGKYGVLASLDLDNFKSFNDNLGTTEGDGVIAISCVLFADLLDKKTLGIPNVEVLRGPGDEIYVVAQNLSKADAIKVKDAVKEASEEILFQYNLDEDQAPLEVTCSASVEMYSNDELKNGVYRKKYEGSIGTKNNEVEASSNLVMVQYMVELMSAASKDVVRIRNFNRFKDQVGDVTLSLLESYLGNMSRQVTWVKQLNSICFSIRGVLASVGSNEGALPRGVEGLVGFYLQTPYPNLETVQNLIELRVVDNKKLESAYNRRPYEFFLSQFLRYNLA